MRIIIIFIYFSANEKRLGTASVASLYALPVVEVLGPECSTLTIFPYRTCNATLQRTIEINKNVFWLSLSSSLLASCLHQPPTPSSFERLYHCSDCPGATCFLLLPSATPSFPLPPIIKYLSIFQIYNIKSFSTAA